GEERSVGNEFVLRGLPTKIADGIPGMPGVLDEAQNNSRLIYHDDKWQDENKVAKEDPGLVVWTKDGIALDIPPDLNPTERATFISKEADGFFRGLMGDRQEQHDRMDVVKMAVDASPTKVAIVGTTTAAGGLSKFDLKNSEPFDHVLIAYYDYNEEKYVIA